MKKILIIIALLASAKVFAQSKSDHLKDDLQYIWDNYGTSESLVIDDNGIVFSLYDNVGPKPVCSDQDYTKVIEYPYKSHGKVLGCETKESVLEKVGNKTYTQAVILNSILKRIYSADIQNFPASYIRDNFGTLFYVRSPRDYETDNTKNLCGNLWTKILTKTKDKILGCESQESILDNVYEGVYKDEDGTFSNIKTALRIKGAIGDARYE
jgi:hypothetical protein